MALAELRSLSATSYFRSTVAILPVLGGDSTFTASILLRELGPTSVTQFICGNVNGSSGWSFVRLSDSNSGATHNYTFTVYEVGVAQTVSFAIPGSVGKMMLFHLAYAGGAPGSLTVYVNGIELITGATSSNAISVSTGRFSIGFNFNAGTQPNPDMGFVAFGYVNTTFISQLIAENTLACVKSQEISNGGLTTPWQYLYSVSRDSGSGVPSVLRNFGTTAASNTLEVVGRTAMQLSSPPSFLGDSVRIATSGGGGNVSGPGASTNNAIATWDGILGDTLQNSVVTVAPGTGNIATPGTVDGRDISVDGTKLDTIAVSATNTPLSAVAPVNVTKSAAVVGVAVTAARADHKHDISTAAAVSITNSTNAEGTATTLARSDHTHAHGNLSGGTLHANAIASGAAGFMTGADKAKLDGIPPGGGGGDVNGPGASTDDAIVTWDGVTGTQVQNSVVTVASISGNITTPGTVDGRDISVDGTKLDTIATGATATPLSAVAPVNVTKSAAVVGVSTAAARADHKHDISTATAVTITDSTNSEGTATTLARSDHTHSHGTRAGGTLHAVATDSVAGFMSASDKAKLDSVPGGDSSLYEIYVSAVNGNDANSGATPLLAVETFARAWELLPTFPTAAVIVHVGSGSYAWADFPTSLQGQNAPIYIWGDGAGQPGDDGFNLVATGTAALGSTATVIVTSAALPFTNSYAGNTVEFNGLSANPFQRKYIRDNTTTVFTVCSKFQDVPVVGDTYEIKTSAIIINVPQGSNIGAGAGYSQVESPLVLINLCFVGSDYATSIRVSNAHILCFGVSVEIGGMTCVDSTIHAGTLYADATDPFGAFGNFLPLQAAAQSRIYVIQQLTAIASDDSEFLWEGWGLGVLFDGVEQIPLVMDSGQFVGHLVAAQLTVSPAAKVALVGGSVLDNGQATSGQLINAGGYLHIQKIATHYNSVGVLNEPGVPFYIATGAGGKTALQTNNGGHTLVDALEFSTNVASVSVLVTGAGSSFISTGTSVGVTGVGDIQVLDGANASFSGTLGLSGATHTVTVDGATLLLDGPAGQFGTAVVTNNATMTVISTGVFRTATALSVLNDSRLDLQSFIDFDGPVTLTDSYMLVSKTSGSLATADLGTLLTMTNSELNLASYPNALRINNGGSATATVLTMVNSKLLQSGMALTITGRSSLTKDSLWLGKGAIGTCAADRITCTESAIKMLASSGSWTIADSAPSLNLALGRFEFTGTSLTIGASAAGLELTTTNDSQLRVSTSGAVLIAGSAFLTDTTFNIEDSSTFTVERSLTLNNAVMELRDVPVVNINQGVDATGLNLTNGSKFIQDTCRVNVDGGVVMRRSSQWFAGSDINGTNTLNGLSQSALTMEQNSVFDMTAVTSGSFVFDANTPVNPVVLSTNAIAHLISASVDVTGAPATAAFVTSFGGCIYFTGVLTAFTASGNDFADGQGAFSFGQVNFAFSTGLYGAVMPGNHPGGTWNATAPGQGAGFVQRIS